MSCLKQSQFREESQEADRHPNKLFGSLDPVCLKLDPPTGLSAYLNQNTAFPFSPPPRPTFTLLFLLFVCLILSWISNQDSWQCILWSQFSFLFKKIFNVFIYFWLCWVFIAVCGLSLVVIPESLIAVPFLVAVVAVHGLSCCVACGIFLEQGSNLSPALAGRFSTPGPRRKSQSQFS